jgi:tryptophan synthase alpha chain
MPAIVGFGISTPEHAVKATRSADGIIIASALMRKLIDGEPIEAVAQLVSDIRIALDAA